MIKTTVVIDGMMCGMCESHINDTIRNKFNVSKVTSSHKKGTSEIISEDKPDYDRLKEAIEETGYRMVSADSCPYEKKVFSLFKRK